MAFYCRDDGAHATLVDSSGAESVVDWGWDHILGAIDAEAATVEPDLPPLRPAAEQVTEITGLPVIMMDDIAMGEMSVAQISRWLAVRLQAHAAKVTDPSGAGRAEAWAARATLDALEVQWPDYWNVEFHRDRSPDPQVARIAAAHAAVAGRLLDLIQSSAGQGALERSGAS